jgi:fucose permease
MRFPFYYGWMMVGFTCLCYGVGIGPAYTSWGYFAPSMVKDLGFSRAEVGNVFGLFILLYSSTGLLVGLFQARCGIRNLMAFGFLLTAAGCLLMSRAQTSWHCYASYAVLAGSGVGLSTIIPCQALGQNWFLRWRALAISVIMASAGFVMMLYPLVNRHVLEASGWRTGWTVIAGLSASLAVFTLLLIRDRPEDLGLLRDGIHPGGATPAAPRGKLAPSDDAWTAAQAIRTPQFRLLLFCGIAYVLPWSAIIAHGRLHFDDLGFNLALATTLMAAMPGASIAGRLAGAGGDWVSPQVVLAVSLALEALGIGGMTFVSSSAGAYACLILIGLGFGAAYVSIPVAFTYFYGRRAFTTTTALRLLITGAINAVAPGLTGFAHDRLGSYVLPFGIILLISLAGAVAACACRHPGAAPVRAGVQNRAPA